FRPRLGRIRDDRARGRRSSRSFIHQVVSAAAKANGGPSESGTNPMPANACQEGELFARSRAGRRAASKTFRSAPARGANAPGDHEIEDCASAVWHPSADAYIRYL